MLASFALYRQSRFAAVSSSACGAGALARHLKK
jgi:hypothetical protein